MPSKARIAVCTEDAAFLKQLKSYMTIDFHTNSMDKLLKFLKKEKCDAVYITTRFKDGELSQLLPHLKDIDTYIHSNWNSPAFDVLLKKFNAKRYVPYNPITKEVLFQQSKLLGYQYVKELITFLEKSKLDLTKLDVAFQAIELRHSKSRASVLKAIRYYIHSLYNGNALDEWFIDIPTVNEFVQLVYNKVIFEHYTYQK